MARYRNPLKRRSVWDRAIQVVLEKIPGVKRRKWRKGYDVDAGTVGKAVGGALLFHVMADGMKAGIDRVTSKIRKGNEKRALNAQQPEHREEREEREVRQTHTETHVEQRLDGPRVNRPARPPRPPAERQERKVEEAAVDREPQDTGASADAPAHEDPVTPIRRSAQKPARAAG